MAAIRSASKKGREIPAAKVVEEKNSHPGQMEPTAQGHASGFEWGRKSARGKRGGRRSGAKGYTLERGKTFGKNNAPQERAARPKQQDNQNEQKHKILGGFLVLPRRKRRERGVPESR